MKAASQSRDEDMNVQQPGNSTAQASPLLREAHGSIALLTLNRPAARNALSEEMIATLHAEIDAISADSTVRAVVIAANGPAFSAGHDLKELTARRSDADCGRGYFQRIMSSCSAMMQAIVHCPKPVIAAVHGIATAAGCQLVATCDLAVAAASARFATPGVDIGLFCSTPMVALTRNVPRKQVMEMLLTGEAIPAERAREIGLVNRVVTDGSERSEALALANLIASKSMHTVKTGKTAFYRQAEMNLAEAYRYASEVMTENMMARDAIEGLSATIEKRKPRWEDK
jgi:enoyl-CoA hydratase/carnithine racemase